MTIKPLWLVAILIGLQGCSTSIEKQTTSPKEINYHPISSALCLLDTCPANTNLKDTIINHKIIILANNPKTKFADWVAYRVKPDLIKGPQRKRNWQQDPSLPANETLPPSAYKGVNAKFKVDRGHQAPLASFKGAKNYYVVNYLSNITPQKSALNRGAWMHLEAAVRNYAKKSGLVYVITGPYYAKNQQPKKDFPNYNGTLMIPKGYFKVVATEGKNGIHATAFVMPQTTPRHANYCKTIAPLTSIAKLTQGLKVLPRKANGNLNKALGC